jgi:hypothetical protein
LPRQSIGAIANSLEPGEEAGYWHTHCSDEVLDVEPGSAIRVGQGVVRTRRCLPGAEGDLRWPGMCEDGGDLPHLPDDATRVDDQPMPWSLPRGT